MNKSSGGSISLIFCIIVFCFVFFRGCSEQSMTRSWGGEMDVFLEPNTKLMEVTWKEDNLWLLTKEMTEELNQKLAEQGCIFKFRFETYLPGSSIGVIYPEFVNKKYLHLLSKCEIDYEGMDFIHNFLKSKGVDWIQYTKAGGLMTYQHDGKVY